MSGTRRRLIVNADDLGYDPAVTRGILESMRAGIVTSTTFMVNMPSSEQAARDASDGGPLAIGLHLNLARGAPVWRGFPAALLEGGGFVEARASELTPEAVERETLAQLDRLAELVGRPATHVDVHKHLHTHPGVLEGLCRAAASRKVPVRAIDAAMRQTLVSRGVRTTDAFIGGAGATAYWTLAQLAKDLATVGDAEVTELMCHPGYAPQTVRSGYSAQRETELATFLDPRARDLVREAGFELADFTALK